MCNLSEGIEERTLKETREKFVHNMHSKGYTLEQIAEVVEISPGEVKKIIEDEVTLV